MAFPSAPVEQLERFDFEGYMRNLSSRLREASRQLPLDPRATGLASLSIATPELGGVNVACLTPRELYWARPDSGTMRIGVGQARVYSASGRHRLTCLNDRLKSLSNHWLHLDPDHINPELGVFAGLAFDTDADLSGIWEGIANSILQVPELLYTQRGSHCYLTFSVDPAQQSDRQLVVTRWLGLAQQLLERLQAPVPAPRPNKLQIADTNESPQHWSQRVETALGAIAKGELDKVVLTRKVRLETTRPIQIGGVLGWLEQRYPRCCHFSIPLAGKLLVGISPERLVRLSAGKVTIDAIAGTRSTGNAATGRMESPPQLQDDLKARREQELVVKDIVRALEPVGKQLSVSDYPQILSLPNVQHLRTEIHANILPGTNLLDLAARLHPTPAVGGSPTANARAWLANHGEHQRGWYTGALGWISPRGDGELVVTLRCALLDGHTATLFAGAGIVHGSDPEQEYLETEWKLQTMLDALGQGG